MADITEEFRGAMMDCGINYHGDINPDGNLHRVHVEGDRLGTKNGAYILHADGHPAGWFQHFSSGIVGRWSANGSNKLSKSDLHAIKMAQRERYAAQAKTQKAAADKANFIWQACSPVVGHPYLTRKNINPYGARVTKQGALVIPLFKDKQIQNLQFIHPDGTKRFLKGARKKSCYFWIGDATETIFICEGYATGCSIYEKTPFQTFIAFDAGNLKPVAEVVRKYHPYARIIIAGDNDPIGREKANAAAIAIKSQVSFPKTHGHDWNDHYTSGDAHE